MHEIEMIHIYYHLSEKTEAFEQNCARRGTLRMPTANCFERDPREHLTDRNTKFVLYPRRKNDNTTYTDLKRNSDGLNSSVRATLRAHGHFVNGHIARALGSRS